MPPHACVRWVRRKMGGILDVERELRDGTSGCAFPCVLCRASLEKFDLVVRCVAPDGTDFRGRMRDPDSPPSKFTSGQKRMFCFFSTTRQESG